MGVPEPISIHAPLTGCDLRSAHQDSGTSYFNPRTPRGVRRPQSSHHYRAWYFNPRTPRGVRPYTDTGLELPAGIPIHAPLAGCDCGSRTSCGSWSHFNPRTPRGVRLRQRRRSDRAGHISIHAPLAGCDGGEDRQHLPGDLFQSTHPSRGATGTHARHGCLFLHFNPRTPRGVRPYTDTGLELPAGIPIHAPLAGCDP